MAPFLAGCALGVVIAVSISAPFLAPWPFRVRYLATAQTFDPLLGFGPTPRVVTRVVNVVSVDAGQGHVEVVVAEVGSGRAARCTTLGRAACAPSVVADLDGSGALHTPLLMIVDDDRRVHLYGPNRAVTDLVVGKAEVRSR